MRDLQGAVLEMKEQAATDNETMLKMMSYMPMMLQWIQSQAGALPAPALAPALALPGGGSVNTGKAEDEPMIVDVVKGQSKEEKKKPGKGGPKARKSGR